MKSKHQLILKVPLKGMEVRPLTFISVFLRGMALSILASTPPSLNQARWATEAATVLSVTPNWKHVHLPDRCNSWFIVLSIDSKTFGPSSLY